MAIAKTKTDKATRFFEENMPNLAIRDPHTEKGPFGWNERTATLDVDPRFSVAAMVHGGRRWHLYYNQGTAHFLVRTWGEGTPSAEDVEAEAVEWATRNDKARATGFLPRK